MSNTTSKRRAGVALVEQGLSIAAAAKQTMVAYTTLHRWCRALGVTSPFPVPRYSPQVRGAARKMRLRGDPIDVIARRLAVRRDTVRAWLSDMGPGRPGNPSKGQVPRVLAMLREGAAVKAICAATGLTASTVYRWRRLLRRGQIPARYTPG